MALYPSREMSGVRKMRAYERFGPTRRTALAFEIVGTYVQVQLLLRSNDVRQVVTRLRRDASAGVEAREAWREAGRVVRPIVRLLTFLPLDSRCLMRSLVLVRMLARRGVASDLVIGARTGQTFAAHAWVEYQGIKLLPDEGYERLVTL